MDLKEDRHLFYLAREGIRAPLPPNYRPCRPSGTTTTYYFDSVSRQLHLEHPCDIHYKKEFVRVKNIEISKRVKRAEVGRQSSNGRCLSSML